MKPLAQRLTRSSSRPAPATPRSGVRALGFLGFALLAALAAGLFLRSYLSRRAEGAVPLVRVFVAAGDLEAGSQLTLDQLKAVDWPAPQLPEGAARRPEEIVGRYLAADLVKGELLLASRLRTQEPGSLLASMLPAGMRAVSVHVDDVVAVAGFIHPGDNVDVIATMRPSESSDTPPVAKVILQNIRVLTVGKELQAVGGNADKPVAATVATLRVATAESEVLALAAARGTLLLALRNRSDEARVETTGTFPALVYGPETMARLKLVKAPAAPVVLSPRRVTVIDRVDAKPEAESSVEILRGDRLESRKFQ